MKTAVRTGLATLALAATLCACKDNAVSDRPAPTISYNHPLAPAGLSSIYIDGVQYPFGDNFDYAEYYSGEDMDDECGYYRRLGFQSAFNIDLNADSEYLQLFLLNAEVKPGYYTITDSAMSAVAALSYRFNDSLTNIQKQHVVSGALEITKADIQAKRVSGIFSCVIESRSDRSRHTIEGSFTDLYLRYEESGGQVMTADISGTNWTSDFSSHSLYNAFANIEGQGRGNAYFAITMHTSESPQNGYESFTVYLHNPIHTGIFDIEPGLAIYDRYVFDSRTNGYALIQSDTNANLAPAAVTVTDYDTVRRRVSGTFDFTIEDGSSRSPLTVRGGRFIDLFW